jgi:hypothetical protein
MAGKNIKTTSQQEVSITLEIPPCLFVPELALLLRNPQSAFRN